jgi:predicted nucleotidyltransferase
MPGTLREILAPLRAGLEALYGLRLVHLLLYGSQARGEATVESDIDVLVVLQGAVDPGVEIARVVPLTASLSLQYNVVISCAFVAEERFRNERSPFLYLAPRLLDSPPPTTQGHRRPRQSIGGADRNSKSPFFLGARSTPCRRTRLLWVFRRAAAARRSALEQGIAQPGHAAPDGIG